MTSILSKTKINLKYGNWGEAMSNCDTCPSNGKCSSEKQKECTVQNNPNNKIKKVIGIMSGKGGVGKSSMAVLIAKSLKKTGASVGVLDADITGPSIPRLLGVSEERAMSDGDEIIPVETQEGIKVMSLNLLVDVENQPVIWRGPVISGVVKQFWTDVRWGDLDYLVIDMPPGTGDVALTVMQSIPVNGVVVVSLPQDMVSMIVSKAVIMARKMDINVLGVIENMSYLKCPDCGKKISIFGGEDIEPFLYSMNLELLGEFPMSRDILKINDIELEEETEKIVDTMTNKIAEKIK